MTDDHIEYGAMLRRAHRFVVRWALERATGPEGPPGEHHFFITFDTQAPGVEIPDGLRARYPEVMTVVIKHRYRDLEVKDASFSVGLWFDGEHARIEVPWASILQFVDPASSFTLRFEDDPRSPGTRLQLSPPREPREDAEIVSLADFRKKQDDDA